MKLFKKLFTAMFALTLTIGMGTKVYATSDQDPSAPTPTPTAEVTGADYDTSYFVVGAERVDLIGHTFNAVQIVKADKYDGTKNPPYTGISWGAQITGNGAALLEALKADDTLNPYFENFVTDAAQVTETNPLFTAAAFTDVIEEHNQATDLEALIKVVQGMNLTGQTIEVDEDMEPVPLTAGIGLYLIDDTTTLTQTSDDVANATILMAAPGDNEINIKVDKPKQDKVVEENVKAEWNEVSDYNIGDYVPYKITSKVPNAKKFENYTMTFTDEMSTGLTFADTITDVDTAYKLKVTVGNKVLDSSKGEYTLATTDAQHFTVTLPVKLNGEKDGPQALTAGDDIVIEFYALLNSGAVIGLNGNTNKSKLTYSNNPDDDSKTTDTPWDTVITFTYKLDVNKIDGETENALPGAQFALMATTGDHANKYVQVGSDGKVTGWTDTAPVADAKNNPALLVSGANGHFNVIGLDDGTYSLIEIKAPKGYNEIEPITLVIAATTANGSDYTDDLKDKPESALTALTLQVNNEDPEPGDVTEGLVSTTVENNSGAVLPSTGGIGTTIFYVLGGLLIAGAGVVLVARRKASE